MSADLQRLKTALADRYAIESQIGAGGMAIVYSALDRRHDRRVAVKVLRPGFLGWAYARAGRRDDAHHILQRLVGADEYVSAIHVALVNLELGLYDEFFVWLDRAIAERSTWLVWIHITPSFEPVWDDPRFLDTLRRLGLEEFVA